MDIKKYIVVQIFCLTTASAGQLDVEVGRTYFGRQEDGTWYQQRFEHTLDVEDRFLGLGYRSQINDSWDWRIGYADLGKTSSNALATTEADYASGCTGAPYCPMYRFEGHGRVHGFSLTAVQSGDGLFTELGIYVFKPTWTVHVTPMDGSNPEGMDYRHIPKWQLSSRLGFGYRNKNTELLVTHYLVEAKGSGENENGVPCERIPGIYDVSKKHPGSFAFTLRVNI